MQNILVRWEHTTSSVLSAGVEGSNGGCVLGRLLVDEGPEGRGEQFALKHAPHNGCLEQVLVTGDLREAGSHMMDLLDLRPPPVFPTVSVDF